MTRDPEQYRALAEAPPKTPVVTDPQDEIETGLDPEEDYRCPEHGPMKDAVRQINEAAG